MSTACQAGFQVCVFQPPDDRRRLGDLLCEHLGVPRADAMHIAAAAPGLLPLPMSEGEAELLAKRVRLLGLDARPVCSVDLPQLRSAEVVHHARCEEDGLHIVELLHSKDGHVLPWGCVETVAVGQLPDGFTRRYAEGSILLTAARRSPLGSVAVRVTPGPELWLALRDPVRSLRVHHELMNYEYLGDRRDTSSTVNFRLFVDDVVRLAPRAFQTASTQAYLAKGPLRAWSFESEEDFERQSLLELLAHRESLGPEDRHRTRESSDLAHAAEAAPGTFHCLHCGSLRQAPVHAPPDCCGHPMALAIPGPHHS